MAESNAKKRKTYNFNEEWEEQFFFTMVNSKCVCYICRASVALPKKSNVERHFRSAHGNFDKDFPLKSALRKEKLKEYKSQLTGQQSYFIKPVTLCKAATIASFRVSRVLAQHKKPLADGEMIKEAFLEASESLFQSFKNKNEIVSAIKDIQLSRRTVTRRTEMMNSDLVDQLNQDITNCICFSLQFDESTDIADISQLCIFVRMVFKDMLVKEELLTILPLKEKTRGEDIYSAFKKYIQENKIPIHKVVSMTTDGAPSMTGSINGFLALCVRDKDFPNFLTYHCIIHQQAICCKIINMRHIMGTCMKIVNSIRGRSLQRRMFRAQLQENESDFGELVYHADVRWLSRAIFLQRFRDLLQEVKEFLQSRGEEYDELSDSVWLMDLAFAADITNHLNELNLQLQGKHQTIVELIGFVNTFKNKLKLMSLQLMKNELKNFKNISDELLKSAATHKFDKEKYYNEIVILLSEFEKRFQDFSRLDPIVTYMCNPFGNVDVEEITENIKSMFSLPLEENEVLLLQCDVMLKAHRSESTNNFWRLMDETKYPNLKKLVYYLTSFFGSTYLCESAFSTMNIIKTKHRSRLTDEHLESSIRLAVTTSVPRYERLVDNMQGGSPSK